MQLDVPPDLEALIKKRLSSGGYTSAEDVLRRALEAQDAEEDWTDDERRALRAHIEEGYPGGAWRTDRRHTGPPSNTVHEGFLASRAQRPRMSGYALTPLAQADIFEIWSLLLVVDKG